MVRFAAAICLLAVICLQTVADEPAKPDKAAVKKLAQELGTATVKGEYAKVIDNTIDTAVEQLGGREQAIKSVEAIMKALTNNGISLTNFQANEPGDFVNEGNSTFVIVPTKLEMKTPDSKLLVKSYFIGVSTDNGKSWKFVDGAGMDNAEFRSKIFPKMPAKLKLPEKEKPEIIK